MNDDFLNRIRVEPPPEFLARLKSRLDLQPPPAIPAPKRATFRNVALGLLFVGSVFAIAWMSQNRSAPHAPANVQTEQPIAVQVAPAKFNATENTPSNGPLTSDITAAKPVTEARPATLTPFVFTLVTERALEPMLTDGNPNNPSRGIIVTTTASASDALTELCGGGTIAKNDARLPLAALVSRRITSSESDNCIHNGANITEIAVGHQVIVLARSRLYGTFSLTPTQIFLALAAEIPDPANPGKLIPNPNTMWSDVDSALEREPIEFFGPAPSSPLGAGFREIIFEAGCRALPAMTAAKQCPNLRNDAVYAEVTEPFDIPLKLQTKPDAIGILPFGLVTQNANTLAPASVAGVLPTTETMATGAYPGSRPLYFYVNHGPGYPPYSGAAFTNRSRFALERFAIIPLERSQP